MPKWLLPMLTKYLFIPLAAFALEIITMFRVHSLGAAVVIFIPWIVYQGLLMNDLIKKEIIGK